MQCERCGESLPEKSKYSICRTCRQAEIKKQLEFLRREKEGPQTILALGNKFKVIELRQPKGGLCYMKRLKYLKSEKYDSLPQFIVGRREGERTMGVFQSDFEGGEFIKYMPLREFDEVYEVD